MNNLADRLNTTFDVKGAMISSVYAFAKLCQTGECESLKKDSKLIVFTHSAQIRGDLANDGTDDSIDIIIDTIQQTQKKFLQDLPTDVTLTTQCRPINLKNVTLTPYSAPNSKLTIDFIQLFTDQIVGVSVG